MQNPEFLKYPDFCNTGRERDAYAARHGYVAWRAARVITHDEKHGEAERPTVVPRNNT